MLLQQLIYREAKHCDIKSDLASLEAYLIARIFEYNFLALVFFISVVELGDLSDNPESLAVKLFLKISIKNIFDRKLIGHNCV